MGGFYGIRTLNEEDIDEEDRVIFEARDAQQLPVEELEPNLAGNHTRQSLAFLSSCTSLPETQILPPTLKMLLLAVANACDSILASKEANKATRLIEAYEGHNNFVEKVSSITPEDSLENLAVRCSAADQNVAVSDFLYMLRTIHLRVRITQ